MDQLLTAGNSKRRTFKWTKQARDLVRSHLHGRGGLRHELIAALAEASGNPRRACVRFARRLGVTDKNTYQTWSAQEIHKLRQLCRSRPVRLVALELHRSETAIRGMLYRLGASTEMGKDRFSKHGLAARLHVPPQLVQWWVDQGWLKAHTEGTEKLPRLVITAKDFVMFCKEHRNVLLDGRIREDRLQVILEFVFEVMCICCQPQWPKRTGGLRGANARSRSIKQTV